MSDCPGFYYRFQTDLAISIICAVCSETVEITDDEF